MYQSDNWNWCACGEVSDVIRLVQRRKALSLICCLECHLYTNKWFSKNLEKQMKPSLSNMQEPPKLQEWVSVQDSQQGRDSQLPERSRKIIGKLLYLLLYAGQVFINYAAVSNRKQIRSHCCLFFRERRKSPQKIRSWGTEFAKILMQIAFVVWVQRGLADSCQD